jgi:hypothetical protein
MPLIVTVNTIAECPRTDCNIYWKGGGPNVFPALWIYLMQCVQLTHSCGTESERVAALKQQTFAAVGYQHRMEYLGGTRQFVNVRVRIVG